jgi:hypothetical protein|tara:strand:- start:657 stop:1019 length:363 start_codon:yes stop_codon:yes gene_type:complete
MTSNTKHGFSILLLVFLFITISAFYYLGWTGILIPLTAFVVFFIMGMYIGFEKMLMHSAYYLGLAIVTAIIIFGLLITLPAYTTLITGVLFVIFFITVVVAVWRWYHGMLGRIQLHRWLT